MRLSRGCVLQKSEHTQGLSQLPYVTVVLRLLIDPRGEIVHGQSVEVEAKSQERFVGWSELMRTLHQGRPLVLQEEELCLDHLFT